MLAAARNDPEDLQGIAFKNPSLNQLPAKDGYFYHVFQCVKACFAKQSQAVAFVVSASHDLDTIFEIFPGKCLAGLMRYFDLTYVNRKQSIYSKSLLKRRKTLSLGKNTSPSCLNTVGFIF